MSLILYVAAPFTHREASTREHRFQVACRASALLMQSNICCFSPLSHSVPIVRYGGKSLDELDSDFWLTMDIPFLERSDELLILGLGGWERSKCVLAEMLFALKNHKPITLIEENEIEKLPKVPKTARRFLESKILTETYDE